MVEGYPQVRICAVAASAQPSVRKGMCGRERKSGRAILAQPERKNL